MARQRRPLCSLLKRRINEEDYRAGFLLHYALAFYSLRGDVGGLCEGV